MATVANLDPTTYESTTGGDFTLGARYGYNRGTYIFVQNSNAAGDTAIAAGDVCYWASTTTSAVSNALTGVGSAIAGNIISGVAVRAIAKNSYGFIQVEGICQVKSDGNTTAGVPQTVDAVATYCTDNAAATTQIIGTALTADTGAGTLVYVNLVL